MTATYQRAIGADPDTGEIRDASAEEAAEAAAIAYFNLEWDRLQRSFNLGGKEALDLAQKTVNATLGAVVKQHHDLLAEDFKPEGRQTRIEGM